MGKIIDKLKEKFKIGEKGIRGLFLALGIGIGATGATAVRTRQERVLCPPAFR